jgi:hypothetical protein
MTVTQLREDATNSGVITFEEIHWLARNRDGFTPQERKAVISLIRFLQQGIINPGCRLSASVGAQNLSDNELRTA